MSLDSEQAMSFQITLLLTSFVYLDVINQQIPVFQNFDNTPMILIFFATVLVIQVALIVGTVWNTKKKHHFQRSRSRLLTQEYFLESLHI